MDKFMNVLTKTEQLALKLRNLYESYGYNQYNMGKFEEYDIYANNKDFLVSESVITFTDTDGKLMALKPDVTLSIIKNNKDREKALNKLYYDENVYRIAKDTKMFKEIRQVGLECLGDIDDISITEVIYLAVMSLKEISDEYVLDISSLDIVKSLLNDAGLTESGKKEILTYLKDKNSSGVYNACINDGITEKNAEMIKGLCNLYGKPTKVFDKLLSYNISAETKEAVSKLKQITDTLKELNIDSNINIDFSVVNDMSYYNGIVFRGFISGVPTGILSGGQYDNLMSRMKKKSSAIGFAVYLDELVKYLKNNAEAVIDTFVLYNNATPVLVMETLNKYKKDGKRVLSGKVKPEKISIKEIVTIE